MHRKPTDWLSLILSGQIDMKDAPKAVQSWARFSIYEGASEIARMPHIDDRKEALEKIPKRIRPYVEAELKRIWPMRHELID